MSKSSKSRSGCHCAGNSKVTPHLIPNIPSTRFPWLPNPSGLHLCGTAYPRWRTLRPAGGSGIGDGLQHPEMSPVFEGKYGSTDKIPRQLTLTFSLDTNTSNEALHKGSLMRCIRGGDKIGGTKRTSYSGIPELASFLYPDSGIPILGRAIRSSSGW